VKSYYAVTTDPTDDWALTDITGMDTQIDNNELKIDISFRESLQNHLNRGYPVIEIFIDSDENSATGDYRSGAKVSFISQSLSDRIKRLSAMTLFLTSNLTVWKHLKKKIVLQ
jgi:hypothetical protein